MSCVRFRNLPIRQCAAVLGADVASWVAGLSGQQAGQSKQAHPGSRRRRFVGCRCAGRLLWKMEGSRKQLPSALPERDIAVLRFDNGKWPPSKILRPDKWQINACPANAASASATTFGKPLVVGSGDAQDYASTAMTDHGAASVKVRFISSAGVPGPVLQIAEGCRMRIGYPRLMQAGSAKDALHTARLLP